MLDNPLFFLGWFISLSLFVCFALVESFAGYDGKNWPFYKYQPVIFKESFYYRCRPEDLMRLIVVHHQKIKGLKISTDTANNRLFFRKSYLALLRPNFIAFGLVEFSSSGENTEARFTGRLPVAMVVMPVLMFFVFSLAFLSKTFPLPTFSEDPLGMILGILALPVICLIAYFWEKSIFLNNARTIDELFEENNIEEI